MNDKNFSEESDIQSARQDESSSKEKAKEVADKPRQGKLIRFNKDIKLENEPDSGDLNDDD